MNKKQKVQITISRQSILPYGEVEDMQSTRLWQSRKVQHWTKTRSNWKASIMNNLDSLKWIYDYIGDTDFTNKVEESDTIVGVNKNLCTIDYSSMHIHRHTKNKCNP